MSVFWALYAFFFAVPFPMILYYSINYAGGERSALSLSGPYLALTYLSVSVLLWTYWLARVFRKWVLQPLRDERRTRRLVREGMLRDAAVIASKATGKMIQGHPQLSVTLRFDNLAGTPIQETLSIVDIQPTQRRFDVGKSVRLRINRDLGTLPVLAIDGSEVQKDQGRWLLAILGWVLLLAAVVAYYLLSYHYEHGGTGWRFLVFFHPLLICPLTLLGIGWLFGGGIGKLFLGTGDVLTLKYGGHRTEARLLDAQQTGTYINEQPQVRFELEYEDVQGITHRATVKKVISLLDMGITKTPVIPIFYLANQPQKVAFAADLEG